MKSILMCLSIVFASTSTFADTRAQKVYEYKCTFTDSHSQQILAEITAGTDSCTNCFKTFKVGNRNVFANVSTNFGYDFEAGVWEVPNTSKINTSLISVSFDLQGPGYDNNGTGSNLLAVNNPKNISARNTDVGVDMNCIRGNAQ